MSQEIFIDKAGRLVLPKKIREHLELQAGDILEASLGADEVRLRPRRMASSRPTRIGGRMVWDAKGHTATLDEMSEALQRGRQERDARSMKL